jgi:hypothetical protein
MRALSRPQGGPQKVEKRSLCTRKRLKEPERCVQKKITFGERVMLYENPGHLSKGKRAEYDLEPTAILTRDKMLIKHQELVMKG